MSTPRPERLRVGLFGASTQGRSCLRTLRLRAGVDVECFFDNDPAMWGASVDGVPVRAAADAASCALDAILISSLHVEPIFHQLARLGVAERTAVSLRDFDARFAAGVEQQFPEPGARSPKPDDHWVELQLRALTWRPVEGRLTNGSTNDPTTDPASGSATGPPGGALAMCTVVSNNYVAYARTVTASFLRHHPMARVFICLVDRLLPDVEYPDAADPRIQVVEARELGIPGFESQAFQYTTLELNTAVKPALFRYLFDHFPIEQLVYLDPDIVVFRPLAPVVEQLARHAIALTPHLTSPVDDGRSPGEADILKAGVFNLGFIGLSRRAETFRFLDWWAARLTRHCVVDPQRGLFVDQRWIDLVPALFDDYVVMKEPGCNVAYWNLHERELTLEHGEPRVNGRPLYFFHYSGFDPDDAAQVSRYQNRHRLSAPGPLRSLFELYAALLASHGHAGTRSLPYAYGTFDNGVPVSDAIRTVYRVSPAAAERFPNPFATTGRSFVEWLNAPVFPGSSVTNLFAGLHATHDELRLAFPDPRGADESAFMNRIDATASALYQLHPIFRQPRGLTMSFYAPVNYRQQPQSAETIAGAVTRARLIVDGYLAHLPASVTLRGSRVLEVGPGAWLGPAVLLACRGASVTVADRYLVPWIDAVHVPLFRALLDDVTGRPGEDPAPIRRLLEAGEFVTDVVGREAHSAERLACADASFDVVFSNAVFEHLEHVPRALSNLGRMTAEGGVAVHQIHFGDHRDDARQLEYLTLDNDLFWSMFELSWGECGNRWRHTDFADAFTRAGFEVMRIDPTSTAPDAYLRDVRPRLHADFASRSDDELRTLCAWMVCRRTGRAPDTALAVRPGLLPTGTGEIDARRVVAPCRILVYGAGAGGRHAFDLLDRLECAGSVMAVCDGDTAVHGSFVRHCRVTRFEDVPVEAYDTVIIASRPGRQEIASRLAAAGLQRRLDLHALGFVDAYGRRLAAAAAA